MPNSSTVLPTQLQRIAQKLQQQQYSQAEQLAEQLNQQQPNHPDVLHLLALATKHRSANEAVGYFQKSLQVKPTQPDVLSNLGNLLQAHQQFKDAKQCYQQALTFNEHSVDAWYNLASVHYRSRDYRAAALERWPEEPNLAFHLALVYRYKEQTADAKQLLVTLKGHIDEAQRVFQLGCLAYDEGHYDRAESLLLESIERQNDLIPAHEALNKLYWESGNNDRFLCSFEQALRQQPDSITLAYAYVSHLFRARHTEQANRVLKQYLSRFGEMHSLVHLRQGEYSKADVLLARARENEP